MNAAKVFHALQIVDKRTSRLLSSLRRIWFLLHSLRYFVEHNTNITWP